VNKKKRETERGERKLSREGGKKERVSLEFLKVIQWSRH
jgi:hypothetical protein